MLEDLYRAGADVPKPVAQAGNAILMAYIGEEGNPAPTLSEVTLPQAEARTLFDRLMENVRLMLEHHLVRADLSAYNVLYWRGSATIIDFPQGVDSLRNRRAFDLLRRDVERLCQYFARYGLRANARAIGRTVEPLRARPDGEMIDRRNQVAACDRGLCSSGSRESKTGRRPRVGLRR